jgi:uncharacterized membrane protein
MEGEIPINGSVRIKYLKGGNSEKAVSFIVSPAPGLEFKPKTASLSFAPGDTETKRSAAIEIANKGSYSLEEISLGIEVDEPRAKTGWFSFEPRETIFDLAAKEKRKIQMVIDAPLNAPKMSFTGRIKASYQSFPPEYLEFSIELSTAQPLLKTRLPTRFFEAQKSQLGNYSEAVFTVSAENLCDCMLASIRLETGAECSGWARLPSPSIETIEAKASASVPIVITAPASAPTGAMQECQLSASYLDPIDGRRKKVVEDFLITAR